MRINKLLILLLSCCFACSDFDPSTIKNLREGKILAIGHAGKGFPNYINPFSPYPDNGFTALQKAMDEGAAGLEVDVQMTKDSVLVLFHDFDLNSKTNLEGCIREKNWSEIEGTKYQTGLLFNRFHDDEIIRLDSLLKWFQNFPEHPYLHLDIRTFIRCFPEDPYQDSEKVGKKILELLRFYQVPTEKVLLISSRKDFILFLQQQAVEFPISYEETYQFQEGLAWSIQHNIKSITIKPKLLNRARVDSAHAVGIEIVTFGGKTEKGVAELAVFHPDIIQANNVGAMISLLSEE